MNQPNQQPQPEPITWLPRPLLRRLCATPVEAVQQYTRFRFSETDTALVPSHLVKAVAGGLGVPSWFISKNLWPATCTERVAS